MSRHYLHHRGSIYLMTLSASLLVAVIAIGAAALGRVHSRAASTANDFAEARIYARSGLELGMLAIYNDPYWRTDLPNGAWYTNQPIGAGSFTLSAVDPINGNFASAQNHPVVLTCTGMKGSARYILSMRMEVGPRVGSCLEVSMCSAGNIQVNGSTTLTSNQTISSNNQVSAGGGAVVNANVEAYKQIQGSGYTGTQTVTGNQRILPDPVHVFDYYNAQGTSIPYSSLPQFQSSEMIANETFETGTSGWYPSVNCKLQQVNNVYQQGFFSMRVTNRHAASDVAATDIPVSSIVPGHVYSVNFNVYPTALDTMDVKLTLTTTTGTFTFTTPATLLTQNMWGHLQTQGNAPLAPIWTGTLTKATVTVESTTNHDYFLDGLSFKDTTLPNNALVIERQLLSPTSNPFTGTTNPLGIYVINCQNHQIIIDNCRIIGTLVLLNAADNSAIQNSVIMEPAAINYPILMTTGKLAIHLSSSALSETYLNVNFNPTGAPYPYLAGQGTFTNSTTGDSYPSSLNGLIYAGSDMTIDTATTIDGAVVSAGQIQVNSTSLNLQYNNIYYNNPPPGFDIATIQMQPVPGTWQRKPSP